MQGKGSSGQPGSGLREALCVQGHTTPPLGIWHHVLLVWLPGAQGGHPTRGEGVRAFQRDSLLLQPPNNSQPSYKESWHLPCPFCVCAIFQKMWLFFYIRQKKSLIHKKPG